MSDAGPNDFTRDLVRWSETLAGGVTVGALAVCNAFGDVFDEATTNVIAGARHPDHGRPAGAPRMRGRPAAGGRPACRQAAGRARPSPSGTSPTSAAKRIRLATSGGSGKKAR